MNQLGQSFGKSIAHVHLPSVWYNLFLCPKNPGCIYRLTITIDLLEKLGWGMENSTTMAR